MVVCISCNTCYSSCADCCSSSCFFVRGLVFAVVVAVVVVAVAVVAVAVSDNDLLRPVSSILQIQSHIAK